MARPLRLEFAGALYHVTSRGNRREAIYETDEDRETFLTELDDGCGGFVMPVDYGWLMGVPVFPARYSSSKYWQSLFGQVGRVNRRGVLPKFIQKD